MVVPTNQLEHSNFDFEQSSNRICIEYVLHRNQPPHPTWLCTVVYFNDYFW
jgi:hypothetical protein